MGLTIDSWLIYAVLVWFYAVLQTGKIDKWLIYAVFQLFVDTTNIPLICSIFADNMPSYLPWSSSRSFPDLLFQDGLILL